MKPEDYKEYAAVFDFLSNPAVFPRLADFCKYLHGVITYKNSQTTPLRVCDVGSGTGYFIHVLHELNPDIALTLVEPGRYMLPILKARFSGKAVSILENPLEAVLPALERQDVVIFQRSLYALSGEIEAYHSVLAQLHRCMNPEGIVAVFDFATKFDIDQMREHLEANRDKLQRDEVTPYAEYWRIMEDGLIRFNNGVDQGEFTLFSQQTMQDVFAASGFEAVFRKDNYCFFKRIEQGNTNDGES